MSSIDFGDVAGVLTGYKTGKIGYTEARKLLRSYGTGDDLIDGLLAVGAGIAVGAVVGNIVDDVVDGLFGDLF